MNRRAALSLVTTLTAVAVALEGGGDIIPPTPDEADDMLEANRRARVRALESHYGALPREYDPPAPTLQVKVYDKQAQLDAHERRTAKLARRAEREAKRVAGLRK